VIYSPAAADRLGVALGEIGGWIAQLHGLDLADSESPTD
jgi:hypothetical protein